MAVILVGGGARSGKSRFALELARLRGTKLVYIATAQALDEEMSERIRRHRENRSPEFTTFEAPLDLAQAIHMPGFDCVVADCLTLWLSNIMLAERDVEAEIEQLAESAVHSPSDLILVTNEVGCGIVPENELARAFRDHAGRLNQRIAAVASEIHWMVFGHPLRVK